MSVGLKHVRILLYLSEIEKNNNNLILNSTYTFCVDRMCSKEQGSEQRRLRSVVHQPICLIIGQSTNQYRKHINHEGGYGGMEDNVKDVEADRVQASRQEVVEPEK